MDELNRIKQSLKEKGIKIYDFGTGDPKEPTPQFIREAIKNAIPEISQYPTVSGRKDLRDAISNYLKRRFNVEVNPDTQVIPSNGSKEAIFHFPLVFIDPSEKKKNVIFGTPAYPVYERGTLFANGEIYPVKLKEEDNFLLRLDKLPSEVLEKTKIVWINYPHNPTGAIADKSYLQDVYHICNEYNIILCSDECYIDLYFEEKDKPVSILEIGSENVVAFHSLSKRSGMTGYRSGFVAGDEKIIQKYKKYRTSFGVATPDFIQQGAKVAWEDDLHVIERNSIFKQKRDIFIQFFNKIGLKYLYPKATFYFWIKTPDSVPAIEYVKKLLEYGIIVSTGENFCAGVEIKEEKCESQYFRIALVPTIEECKEAIKVWERAHKELIGA
jgi:succinyldiaminopimelate transaminase